MDEADIERIVMAVTAATARRGGVRPSVGQKAAALGARIPPRTKVIVGTGVLLVAAGLSFRALTPTKPDTAQITAVATKAATAQALDATRADLERARAESTQIVVADAFAWAPLPLTETARSIIGYDAATNFATLNQPRAEVVAKQARALLVGATLPSLRLVANSPTDLRVTQNPGEGVQLFETAAPAKPAAAATPTSALPTNTTGG